MDRYFVAGLLSALLATIAVSIWRAVKRRPRLVEAQPTSLTAAAAMAFYYLGWLRVTVWIAGPEARGHAHAVAAAYVAGQLIAAVWRRRFLLAGDLVAVPVALSAVLISVLAHVYWDLWHYDVATQALVKPLVAFLAAVPAGHVVVLVVLGILAAAMRLVPVFRDRVAGRIPGRIKLAWCVAPSERPTDTGRPWLQFRLSTLLTATVVLGVLSGWVGTFIQRYGRQQQAVEAILKAGGEVHFAYEFRDSGIRRGPPGPERLRELLGENFFATAECVTLPNMAGDRDLEHVRHLWGLKDLHLSRTRVTDASMGHLRNLHRLEVLDLGGTEVGDAGLANLEGLTHLKKLTLDFTPVTDASVPMLQRLPNLDTISLGDTLVTSAAADRLHQSRQWEAFHHVAAPSEEHRRAVASLERMEGAWVDVWPDPDKPQRVHRGIYFWDRNRPSAEREEIIEQFQHLQQVTELILPDLGAPDSVGQMVARMAGLRRLDWPGAAVSDSHLEYLASLTSLETLQIHSPKVTDAGLQHLASLTAVDFLDLAGTSITDAGLAHLEAMQRLRHLNLARTGVTGPGLAHLDCDAGLVDLWLDATPLTDAGLEHVARHTNLKWLDLAGTQITDAGLAHLKTLVNLEWLYLGGTRITDAGLARLTPLTGLTQVDLNATQITDAGLAHLESLSALEEVGLRGTKVTPAGVERLKAALPDTIVDWWAPPGPPAPPAPQPVQAANPDDEPHEPADADGPDGSPGERAEKATESVPR